jgi:NAD(P)H-quinone oxidoreductase subunit 4
VTTSDVYSSTFKVVVTFLTAVGLIITPIYLLSMLRVVFYGNKNPELTLDTFSLDAKPREVFVTVCLLIPIVAIGLYPKLATNTYDVKTVQVAEKIRDAFPVIVQSQGPSFPSVFDSVAFVAPEL